jgi:Apea-like HEPN
MTLRPGEVPGRAVAVFPFLKTSDQITLSRFTFRSTDDTTGLDAEDAAHIREIADMLYLQNDLRIRSAAYSMLPALDLDKAQPAVAELERIQTIVAFCYSHPHPTFGIPFLGFEQASLAIFSPEAVPIFMVRPEHDVRATGPETELKKDEWHRVAGYYGRYNFRHPFWVVKNSRLYPPVPNIGLNHSQDLAYDLGRCFESPRYHLLPALLTEPTNATADRVLRSLCWFNRANTLHIDDDNAILDLSVTFETLLGLPRDAKTDRFVDAVSMLLGRVERLDTWAEQFYEARSDVAHEGETTRSHFAPQKQNNQSDAAPYQSHLVYGRQIFQLCVGAVLFGASLSKDAGLEEKFITNEERLKLICRTLEDETRPGRERFDEIAETVNLIDNFRFVGETGPLIKTLAGAAQIAARRLLQCGDTLDPALKTSLEALANAPRSHDSCEALEAVKNLLDLKIALPADPRSPESITRRLADIVWHYCFMPYYWLAEQRSNKASQANKGSA